jgi:hypothetical protein
MFIKGVRAEEDGIAEFETADAASGDADLGGEPDEHRDTGRTLPLHADILPSAAVGSDDAAAGGSTEPRAQH